MKKKQFICMLTSTAAGIFLCIGFGMYCAKFPWESRLSIGLGSMLAFLSLLTYRSSIGKQQISLYGNTLNIMTLSILGTILLSFGIFLCAYQLLFGLVCCMLGIGIIYPSLSMCYALQ